jgi:hypothetical protein
MLPGDLFLAMVVINRIPVRCRWLGTGTARPGVTLRVVLGQPTAG